MNKRNSGSPFLSFTYFIPANRWSILSPFTFIRLVKEEVSYAADNNAAVWYVTNKVMGNPVLSALPDINSRAMPVYGAALFYQIVDYQIPFVYIFMTWTVAAQKDSCSPNIFY